MAVAYLIAMGGASPKVAAAADLYGLHWILRTPTYTFNSDGRTQHAKFVVTDGVYSGEDDGHPYHLAVLYASFHSRWRIGQSSFKESEQYSVPLDGDGNRDDFQHSQRTGEARLRVRIPSYGLRIDLGFATQRIRRSTCDRGNTVAAGAVSGTLRFDPPGSTVHPLTKLPHHATLLHRAPRCGALPYYSPHSGQVYDRPCMADGLGVDGRTNPSDLLQLIVVRDSDAGTATIRAETDTVGHHLLVTTEPAQRLAVAQDLSSISIRGEKDSQVTGAAHAASGPAQPPFPGTPSTCQGTATGESRTNSQLQGSLTLDFGFGGRRAVASTTVSPTAFHETTVSN